MEKRIGQTVLKNYEAPRVEVITVEVEQGFAASQPVTTVHEDTYIEDAEDGGIPWSTLMRD